MPHEPAPLLRLSSVMLLPLLLAACASAPNNSPPSVAPLVPPLPLEARQPALPAWCSPTCSAGWRRMVETLLQPQTQPTVPVSPAKPNTTL